MTKSFFVSITTPESTLFNARAVSLVAPAELGYLGILADHAPLIAHLVSGTISLRDESGRQTRIACAQRGYLEVSNNQATLLLSSGKLLDSL